MTPNDAELEVIDSIIDCFKSGNTRSQCDDIKLYLEKFNALSLYDKRDIVFDWIVNGQFASVAESVLGGVDITLPAFGTITINSSTIVFKQIKDNLAREYGYNRYADCPKELRVKINNIAKEQQKEPQYELRKRIAELRNNDVHKELTPSEEFLQKLQKNKVKNN